MREGEREREPKAKKQKFSVAEKELFERHCVLVSFCFRLEKNTTKLISMEHKSSNNGEFKIQVSSV